MLPAVILTQNKTEGTVPILLNKTIRLFLDSIGRRDEYEYYLERFRSDHSGAFALVCPMGENFADVAPLFTFDLKFLLRLELDPVILLCGPNALKMRNMLFSGDHPYKSRLVDISGKNIRDHTTDILEYLEECRQSSKILVLMDPSTPLEGALRQIVPTVSRRIHFVRTAGPLRDKSGAPLFYYYTRGGERIEPTEDDRDLADVAAHLLNHDPRAHISIASPLQLLQELFTIKGAGCIVKAGSEIHRFSSTLLIDRDRLIALLERSFGRRIISQAFLKRLTDLYIEHDYRGGALLEPYGKAMYLSKFTVERAARGEGLAQELWNRLSADHRAVFWRSRINNRINHWYEKLADGSQREKEWRIFWRGIAADDIPGIIHFALGQEKDFEEQPETSG